MIPLMFGLRQVYKMSSQTVEMLTLSEIYTELKQLREEFHQVKESLNYIINSSSKQKSISEFEFEQEKEGTVWYHKYIDSMSNICGGNPIIKGTQTPVSDIIQCSRSQDVVGILQSIPHLTREQIEAALVYYAHEPELVDEYIKQKLTSQSYIHNENSPRSPLIKGEESGTVWYHQYIACVPGVCGGYPIIKGTRTPIRAIVEYSRSWNVIEMITNLPHLTQQQVHAALIYYVHEPSLVDEDIKRNERAWKELTSRSWPVQA
jgi:uncharacterized protein (DUF433 family)